MPSKILKEKSETEILSPTAKQFTVGDKEFAIYPMPDSVLMGLGEALSAVIAVAQGVGAFQPEKDESGQPVLSTDGSPKLRIPGASEILPLLPQLIKILLPNATKIIAACLKQPEEWVAENVGLAKKLEALRLILEAEDMPLIVENFMRMSSIFKPVKTP